jgi:NAD(P)-dependent dehydrogenase (short-subunit alcohol dehydrogenase family)
MRFKDKLVIVTGAASGIGRATAIAFAGEGARVAIADINTAGLEDTALQIGAAASIRTFDCTDAGACRSLVETAASESGIDVLCNIAGVLDWGPLADFDESRWARVLRTNLDSTYFMCRAAMPHLIKTKGAIVNLSSAAGLVGIAYTSAYCASKAGIIAITRSLAIEFASAGVRVNAVCPTQVDTPMTRSAPPENIDWTLVMRNAPKLGGACAPEDIAAAVLWLASEDAHKISGIALPVDAAQTAG